MNPTNRADVEQFFRNQPLYPMATSIKDIEKNLWQYSFHFIDYKEELLTVDYSIGNTDEFGSKDYPLQEFLDWIDITADKTDWMAYEEGTDYGRMVYTFQLYDYIEANEKALVTEFFNINK